MLYRLLPLARPAVLAEGGDDVTEGEEALVDGDALLEALALRARLLRALRSGEINEMELGACAVLPGGSRPLLNNHGEERVRARRDGVHEGGTSRAAIRSGGEGREELLARVHHTLVHAQDEDATGSVLTDGDLLRGGARTEEVLDLLVVDLEVCGDGTRTA